MSKNRIRFNNSMKYDILTQNSKISTYLSFINDRVLLNYKIFIIKL